MNTPFIAIWWENDIPDAVQRFVNEIPGHIVTLNGRDVEVLDYQDDNFVCRAWDNSIGTGVGDRFTIPVIELREVVFF